MRHEWKEMIEKEMMIDTERIMEEINADPAFKDVKAPEELHDRVFAQIREYEEQRLLEQLSDADKELLRLGKVYKRRRKWKKCLILVAAAVVVLTFGTVCIGEDENIFNVMSRMFDGEEETVVDSEDVEPIVYIEEDEAFKEIEEIYGFTPVKLRYLPQNIIFHEASFSADMQYINMIYEIDNETVLIYMIRPNYRESSFGTVIEDEKIQEYQMIVEDVEITVVEYSIMEKGECKWSVSFVYQDVQYLLRINNMQREEVEKIINNLRF